MGSAVFFFFEWLASWVIGHNGWNSCLVATTSSETALDLPGGLWNVHYARQRAVNTQKKGEQGWSQDVHVVDVVSMAQR